MLRRSGEPTEGAQLERSLEAEKHWKRAKGLGHQQAGEMLRAVKNKRAQVTVEPGRCSMRAPTMADEGTCGCQDTRSKAEALLQQDKFDKALGMYQVPPPAPRRISRTGVAAARLIAARGGPGGAEHLVRQQGACRSLPQRPRHCLRPAGPPVLLG